MGGYRSRKTGNRKPYQILVVVCEGEKTERIYFNNYKKRGCNLKIETPNCKVTDPINLVKFALTQISRYDLDFKNGDCIWCVFDANHNTNEQITTAIQLAKKNIQIALSNPCFELWYLLHFTYHCGRLNTRDANSLLKKHIPKYDKTNDHFDELLNGRNTAILNSKKLNDYHEGNNIDLLSLKSNPSTQIFQIVEYILSITECKK
jgi:hypothetical protein